MKFSKFIVIFVIMLNIAFTVSVLVINATSGNEPSVLIGAWFSFTTVELWALKDIKLKEDKGKKKKKASDE